MNEEMNDKTISSIGGDGLQNNDESNFNSDNSKILDPNENTFTNINKESKDDNDKLVSNKCFVCNSKNPEIIHQFQKCNHSICRDCFNILLLVDIQYLNQIFQIHENKNYKIKCKCGQGELFFLSEELIKNLENIEISDLADDSKKEPICIDCKNTAKVYCMECECFSCDECFAIAHPARIKRLADHPKTTDFSKLNIKDKKIKCSRDGEEYILFCNTCNYLLCNVCKTSHNNHKTEPITNIIKKFDEKNQFISGEKPNNIIFDKNIDLSKTIAIKAEEGAVNLVENKTENLSASISDKNLMVGSLNNKNTLSIDEKQNNNIIEFKKRVLDVCDQITKIISKLVVDFEESIDFQMKEKTNMNSIRTLISKKAKNLSNSPNIIYFLNNLNFFTRNSLLKSVQTEIQFNIDSSLLKTLEQIKGSIPYIYPSNCILKYSYMNKVNLAAEEIRNKNLISSRATYENPKNSVLNLTINKLKEFEEDMKANSDNNSKLNNSKNDSVLLNQSMSKNNNLEKAKIQTNMDQYDIQDSKEFVLNPCDFKKINNIKIEDIKTNDMNSFYFTEESDSKMVTKKNINFNNEKDRKIKSISVINYFDKRLLVYSISNTFYLHDLDSNKLYYQSEVADDVINNIFYQKIQGVPILIIVCKKRCVFWDILTKQTVWKFNVDHFNFDNFLMIDLEFELLGVNPAHPLNDETKLYMESYFNKIDFAVYLKGLSVILWQSDYSAYAPYEYFYTDSDSEPSKRKLFANNNTSSNSKSVEQYGFVNKLISRNGILFLQCGFNGIIRFYKYNNPIPETIENKYEELFNNRSNYFIETLTPTFSINIEGYYSGFFNYPKNGKSICYFITYTGILEKCLIYDKNERLPNPDFKVDKLKVNKYNGLFKIFEWNWDFMILYGEKVLYVYSLVEDLVVKTIKTNFEISKLIRFYHGSFGDSLGIVYKSGDFDIYHI